MVSYENRSVRFVELSRALVAALHEQKRLVADLPSPDRDERIQLVRRTLETIRSQLRALEAEAEPYSRSR